MTKKPEGAAAELARGPQDDAFRVKPLRARQALLAASRLVSMGFPVLWLVSPAKDRRRTPEGDRVIPPERRGKAPVQEGWQSLPAQSFEALADLWGDGEPGYNVGIRTGRVEGARLPVVVIDLDSPAALAWAQAHLPETQLKVRTRAGQHWYYRAPAGRTGNRVKVTLGGKAGCRHRWQEGACQACGASKLDLDVKGDGGLVVGPASVHGTGVRYEGVLPWTQERADSMPVFDPSWFGAGAEWEGGEDPALPADEGRRPPVYVDLSSKRRRAAAYLEGCPGTISGQGTASNDCLGFARALVYGLCIPPEEAARIMVDHEWNARCADSRGEPYPWSRDELLHKCRDAYRLRFEKPYGFLLLEKDPGRARPAAERGRGPDDAAAAELEDHNREEAERDEAAQAWDFEVPEQEVDLPPAGWPLTDTGNAERLGARYGESVRWAEDRQVWMAWDASTGRWVPRPVALERCSKVVARRILDELSNLEIRVADAEAELEAEGGPVGDGEAGTPERRRAEAALRRAQKALEAVRSWQKASEAAGKRRAMVAMAASEPSIAVGSDAFDRHPFLLNVRNGVLDLREGTLRPHDRDLYLTKASAVPYRADAACPTWDRCLRTWTGGDAELEAFLRRAAGYSLTGSTEEECLLIFVGAGQNGKSTFVNALAAVLGPYATVAPAGLLMETRQDKATPSQQAGLAALVGVRLVCAAETDDSAHLSQAQVKAISCRDRISAKRMYEGPFDFVPTHKTMLSTNYEPGISGTDEGIWRRVHLVRWAHKVSEEDRDNRLAEKLLAERPGILAWAARGCREWMAQRLNPPDCVRTALKEYRAKQDTVGAFLEDVLEVTRGQQVSKAALRQAYEAWCDNEGHRPFGAKRLSQELERRGLTEHRTPGTRYWSGVKFRRPEGGHHG